MIPSPILRGACAAFLAALCLPALPLRAQENNHPRTAANAVTPNNRNPNRHAEFMKAKEKGPIDLLFLGDSITDFWPSRSPESWAKFAPDHPADFAVSGERTEDVLWRITHGELDGLHPKVVVLLLGTNNIGQHADEQPGWTVAGMRKVVDTIEEKLPTSKILLLAIFPRGDKNSSERRRNNEVNAELAKFADGYKVRYLDIGKVFVDANGEIPKDVMPDSLHPAAKGYDLWYDAMEPTLSQMMK